MTVKNLSRLINLALVATVLVTVVTSVFALLLPYFDEHLLTTWQIELSHSAQSFNAVLKAGEWGIEKNQGVLFIQTSGFGYAISRAITILLIGGLVTYALYSFRTFAGDLQSERPFQASTPDLLKKMGLSLIALAALLYIEVVTRFYLFIPNATDIADFYVTHIKVSPPDTETFFIFPGVEWGLIIAGVFLLAIAKAFALGLSLQTENDEII
ncbi:DUF2975 domain-containing protein [Idiomarina sp. HP20-50]|uniref:DUF2975 domain-containing protein n=1 Tax=Idiomarina sp. HP20-50 TaxID=3070813 RepID=UPI00294B4288|nr:DUF2975 domain-containing protein [Idiomarina sp. HP20-50]MDV6316693.1 DUF2975 domain-containing protein [Idiomarina sp. HP20-50]